MNQIKIALVLIVAMFVLMVVGGVTPTSAGSPAGAPPTVGLPTPIATATKSAQPSTGPAAAPTRAPASIKPTVASAAVKGKSPNSVPGPGGTFSSAFTVQNFSSSIATCSYAFYDSAGNAAYTSSSFSIAVGSSNFTYVPNISGLTSGQYTGVVSCDQQVGAVVNFSTSSSAGTYDAVGSPGTTSYAPNAYSNYYNFASNFVVQNTTSSAVDVTVQIIAAGGAVAYTYPVTNIPANGSANFDQTGLSQLAQNVLYSAKITATGNIAVIANNYGLSGTVAANQLYTYDPLATGSTTLYAPLIMNNYYSNNTALTVQNIGSASTDVRVTYSTGLQSTQTVAPSSSALFYTPGSGLPAGNMNNVGIYSAKIESLGGQPIVALVNQSNPYNRAASTTAFSGGTTTVGAPIVLKRYYNFNTSVTCQNIGSAATNMTITYNNGASSTQNSIPANGTALFYQPNESGLPNGFNGSATITSSGQPIVCVVNQDQNEGSFATTNFDMLDAYEGYNQ
jgi:hypothetical protein